MAGEAETNVCTLVQAFDLVLTAYLYLYSLAHSLYPSGLDTLSHPLTTQVPRPSTVHISIISKGSVVVVVTGSGSIAVGRTVGNVVPDWSVVVAGVDAWRITRCCCSAAHTRPIIWVPTGVVPPGHDLTHLPSCRYVRSPHCAPVWLSTGIKNIWL